MGLEEALARSVDRIAYSLAYDISVIDRRTGENVTTETLAPLYLVAEKYLGLRPSFNDLKGALDGYEKIPEYHKVLPIYASQEMIDAGRACADKWFDEQGRVKCSLEVLCAIIYEKMLGAYKND